MSIEKQLADKVLFSISIKDKENVEKFYQEYLKYTRETLKTFDEQLQSKVMFKYGEYITEYI